VHEFLHQRKPFQQEAAEVRILLLETARQPDYIIDELR
jgi:hypothetical protein